jgi:phosphatidylethanolamine/phosphatidyl-N-methylethanolamine N-methyltransferase
VTLAQRLNDDNPAVARKIKLMIRMFRRFLATPGMIGSITPSSTALAKAMTRQIGHGVAVFEIGAGTGAITRCIQKTTRSGPLVVFEQDPLMAEHLRHQSGQAKVVEGFFHDTVGGLGEIPDPLVILSSVPFKSLSENLHANTVDAICHLLLASPNRRLIQYTYFDRPPFTAPNRNLHWRRLTRVWANLPPATVWELRRETAALAVCAE